jgi:hypothetical protein
MKPLVAAPIGSPGFVSFARDLHRLGVLDHDELLGWLRLHGSLIRATEPALADEDEIDEDALLALRLEFEDVDA